MKKLIRSIDPVGLYLPCLLLVLWYVSAKTGIIPSYLLPGPDRLLLVLVDFATGLSGLGPYAGKLLEHVSASLFRVLAGFAVAASAGLPAGILTGRITLVRRMLDPLIHAVRTIPGIGWLPIAMVWFGIGRQTTIFLIALAAFFPVYMNTAHGLATVPQILVRAGKMLGATQGALLRTVLIPSAFPSIVTGLKLGLGVSWSYLVLGELTGVTSGLGAVMMDSRMLGRVDLVLAAMICIALLGIVTDRLLLLACQRLYPVRISGT